MGAMSTDVSETLSHSINGVDKTSQDDQIVEYRSEKFIPGKKAKSQPRQCRRSEKTAGKCSPTQNQPPILFPNMENLV